MKKNKRLLVIDKFRGILRLLSQLPQHIPLTSHITHAPKDTSIRLHQVPWSPVLHDLTLIQNKDFVIIDNRLQPMRNSNSRVLNLPDRFLNLRISGVVDGGRGFVHQQDFGDFEKSPG